MVTKTVIKRRDFTDEEKHAFIEGLKSSEMGLQQYCLCQAIGYKSLQLWMRNLALYGKVTRARGWKQKKGWNHKESMRASNDPKALKPTSNKVLRQLAIYKEIAGMYKELAELE